MALKKSYLVAAAFLAISLISIPAFAELRPGAFTLTPQLGGYIFEGDQGPEEHDFYLGLGAGYVLNEHIGLEGTLGDSSAYLYKIDGLYYFKPCCNIQPYVAAGIGGLSIDADENGSSTKFILDCGGGAQYFITDNLAVRGDMRYLITIDQGFNNLMYTAGVTYYFGGGAPAPAPAPAPVAAAPAPPAPVVEAPAPPPPPAPAPVVEAPAPPPPAPAPVVEAPAPIVEEKVIDVLVEFDFDKYFVRPIYHDELKRVSDYLKQYPNNMAELQGHTDGKGKAAYNKKLSQERVDAVREYMIKEFGVDGTKLTAVGYGMEKPIATNKTDEGRQRNRRVELHIKPLAK